MVDAGEADQQLKTVSLYRTVPLHSALIGHQFLDYVESRRSQGKVFCSMTNHQAKTTTGRITSPVASNATNEAGIVGQGPSHHLRD